MSNYQLPSALTKFLLAMLVVSVGGCAHEVSGNTYFRLTIPECESSALLAANCPNAQPECLWMADNERDNALFLIGANTADTVKPATVALVNADKKPVEVGDIEALAALPNGQVLAVGSHSLKSSCDTSKKRHSFAVIEPNSGLTTLLTWPDKFVDCAAAFPTQRPADTNAFCAAVAVANEEAKKRRADPSVAASCADLESFNIEGAAADQKGRIWLGLRAPLLDRTGGARDAVLLRMYASADPLMPAPGFDELIKLDLEGFGVRELSATKDALMIVAGPALDKNAPFRLYRLLWSELDSGEKLLKPRKVMDLETSSEGFALVGKYAFTALDGDDKNKALCSQHKHLSRFLLPQ